MVLRLASLAVLALAGTIEAQEPTRTPARAPTVPARRVPLTVDSIPEQLGWLGFRTDPGNSAIIVEVAPDSPADRAGVRPGDRIVSSDWLEQSARTTTDSALGQRPAGLRRYLAGPVTGRTYEMTLARGEETFAIAMTAVRPPEYQRSLLRATRAPGSPPDTLREEIDAYRTELARTTLQPSRRPSSMGAQQPDSQRARTQPTRVGEVEAAARRAGNASVMTDLDLYDQLTRTTDRRQTILALRSSAVAGAEFEQLNPALGQYFGGISEGVFVLRVGAESPAATAGLEPGDIVQSVNGERILTVPALRERVGSATGTITLQVIRKGRPVTVTLRREE